MDNSIAFLDELSSLLGSFTGASANEWLFFVMAAPVVLFATMYLYAKLLHDLSKDDKCARVRRPPR